jgi:hypothetical protein
MTSKFIRGFLRSLLRLALTAVLILIGGLLLAPLTDEGVANLVEGTAARFEAAVEAFQRWTLAVLYKRALFEAPSDTLCHAPLVPPGVGSPPLGMASSTLKAAAFPSAARIDAEFRATTPRIGAMHWQHSINRNTTAANSGHWRTMTEYLTAWHSEKLRSYRSRSILAISDIWS